MMDVGLVIKCIIHTDIGSKLQLSNYIDYRHILGLFINKTVKIYKISSLFILLLFASVANALLSRTT